MSQPHAPAYVYEPLNFQDSIRLLELLPGVKDSPLRCNITEVRRGDMPKYEALSYAWGEPVFPHIIEEVDSGTRLNITVNLYTALHGIRSEEMSRILWIDAICINQLELKEKSHQVSSMGTIFAHAHRVIVWLGSHEGTAEEVVDLLRSIRSSFLSSPGGDSPPFREIRQLHILQFFAQPWYSRLWVVQEFVLAREVLFMMAGESIDLDQLDLVVRLMVKAAQHDEDFRVLMISSGIISLVDSLQRMERLFRYRCQHQGSDGEIPTWQPRALHHHDVDMSLAQCVTELSLEKDCKEDRDRIYGVLAIAKNDLGIVPDYELPLHVVYNDFAVRSLLSGDSVLLHTSGVRPDHQSEFRSFVPHLTNRHSITYRLDASEFHFARPTRSFVVRPSTRGHLPCISGVRIDTICRTEDILRPRDMPEDAFEDYRHTLTAMEIIVSNFADWLSKSAIPPKHPDQVSTVWDFVPDKTNLQWEVIDEQWAEARMCIDWAVINDYQGFDIEMATKLENRHVFQTKQGYIGFGPFWMRPGDQVVMFDRGVTPFIIRENVSKKTEMRDTWLHVGDCYLHGWMHGDYFGHTIVDELPPESSKDKETLADEKKKYLVREWFTLA